MKPIGDIKTIDEEFGKAIEETGKETGEYALPLNKKFGTDGGRKENKKLKAQIELIVRSSPWALFTVEVARMLSREPGTIEYKELERIIERIPKLKREYLADILRNEIKGLLAATRFLNLFYKAKTLNPRRVKSSKLNYFDYNQVMRRLVLELHGFPPEVQPSWFKLLMFLAKEPHEFSLRELPDEVAPDKTTTANIKGYPLIFHKNICTNEGKRGRSQNNLVFFRVEEDFYNNIYHPLRSWLSWRGYEVYKEWVDTYHWGRKID